MNFIDQYEKKWFPNFYNQRLNARRQQAYALKDKAIKDPESLEWYQIKPLMKVMRYDNVMPDDPISHQYEKRSLLYMALGPFPSALIGLSPYLIRQFHRQSKARRNLTVTAITLISYIAILYQPLSDQLNCYRKLVHKYAPKMVVIEKGQKKA